ncbi:transglycosylase family protein [Streptomyces vinaceus]|uniref:transglycosylase family protein n=1 Tax=Streptomyces vinaceus TaxID=1960 RepID=UPI003815EC0A
MSISGKGRHRKPSRASRAVGIASVTGVAVAAPLLTAGAASAATASQWDAVAKCESGGRWDINTGNGYYGGLQFKASTWTSHGGGKYATHAHLATKAQQIEIAEKVLKNQGRGAWGKCGLGLSASTAPGAPKTKPAAEKKSTPPEALKAPQKKAPKEPATPPSSTGDYRVQAGDTLSMIAITHGVEGGWQALHDLNKAEVPDADMIHPGQQLKLS